MNKTLLICMLSSLLSVPVNAAIYSNNNGKTISTKNNTHLIKNNNVIIKQNNNVIIKPNNNVIIKPSNNVIIKQNNNVIISPNTTHVVKTTNVVTVSSYNKWVYPVTPTWHGWHGGKVVIVDSSHSHYDPFLYAMSFMSMAILIDQSNNKPYTEEGKPVKVKERDCKDNDSGKTEVIDLDDMVILLVCK